MRQKEKEIYTIVYKTKDSVKTASFKKKRAATRIYQLLISRDLGLNPYNIVFAKIDKNNQCLVSHHKDDIDIYLLQTTIV